MKQTVSGNIKCFNISCNDEDIEKSIVNEIKIIKRKPTFDYILNDLAFKSLKFKVIHGVASNQDKFDFDYQLKLKDKEILEMKHRINDLIKDNTEYKLENLRLNNIINTFEDDLKREINISQQESMVESYKYSVIHSTLEKMLKYFRELKESKK